MKLTVVFALIISTCTLGLAQTCGQQGQPPCLIDNLGDFMTCIGPSGAAIYGDTCQLSPSNSPYVATSSLRIGRSGTAGNPLVITGDGVSPGDVVIRRGSAAVGALMGLSGPSITNIQITYLTFDGNRYGPGLNLNCQQDPNTGPTDLDLYYADPGTAQGPYTLEFLDFINAPATALKLAGNGMGNAGTIAHSNFGQGGTGYGPNGYGKETPQETASRGTAAYVGGSYGGVYYSNIADAGTAGITLIGSTQYAYGNLLQQNRYEDSDGSGGGQLTVDVGSSYAQVAGNVINGNYWPAYNNPPASVNGCQWTAGNAQNAGIEGYGTGHNFWNNEVEQSSGGGMQFGGSHYTAQITISSSNPFDTDDLPRYIEGNVDGGIGFLGPNIGGWQYPTVGVTLDDVLVRNNGLLGSSTVQFGILLDGTSNSGSYVGFTNGSCMSGNAANAPPPSANISPESWNTLTNQTPSSYTTYQGGPCPASGDQTPAQPGQ